MCPAALSCLFSAAAELFLVIILLCGAAHGKVVEGPLKAVSQFNGAVSSIMSAWLVILGAAVLAAVLGAPQLGEASRASCRLCVQPNRCMSPLAFLRFSSLALLRQQCR